MNDWEVLFMVICMILGPFVLPGLALFVVVSFANAVIAYIRGRRTGRVDSEEHSNEG